MFCNPQYYFIIY